MWHIEKSDIHGLGVFASKNLLAGTKIAKVANYSLSEIFEMTDFGSLVNHQTRGNCELHEEADHCFWLYTQVDIPKDSELVSDYKKVPFPFDSDTKGFIEK